MGLKCYHMLGSKGGEIYSAPSTPGAKAADLSFFCPPRIPQPLNEATNTHAHTAAAGAATHDGNLARVVGEMSGRG